MDEPTATEPTEAAAGDRRNADVESGDRAPNRPTRLERAPSDRYAREEPVSRSIGTRGRAVRAIGVAIAGAVLIAFLGGPLSVTAGLLAVSVVLGLVLGAMLRPVTIAAVGLAVGAVLVGLLGVWLFARAEGGVLDPLAYFGDVEGPLVPIELVLAGLAALVSSR